MVFNIIAIPSGVYRYIREGRMAWPLAWIIILGTLPGIFIGAAIRVSYLPDPKHFKVFMGFVLLYMALRLVLDLRAKTGQEKSKTEEVEKSFRERSARMLTAVAAGETRNPVIRTTRFSLTEYAYEFYGEKFSFNTMTLSSLAFAVFFTSPFTPSPGRLSSEPSSLRLPEPFSMP
ncbi:MAG: putative permease [Deltaproteobacteria bacterium]|nr:putative permease [Deltaproteobacteria bacterium]